MKTKIFKQIESMNPIYLGASDKELYQKVLEEHSGRTFAEIKEDGYRVQIHKKGDKIKGFTRSGKEVVLELFPELTSSLKRLPDCILDTELAGDKKVGHQGFDYVKKRFRHRISENGLEKYLSSGLVENFPLGLKVFDTLNWNGLDLVNECLEVRRAYTEVIAERKIVPSVQEDIRDSEDLKDWFEVLVGNGYEGLVCKNPDSIYLAGKKTTDWIKLKRSECLDLTILGVYLDNNHISQILCGTYNSKKRVFETLAKVNAKREGMNMALESLLDKHLEKNCPSNVVLHPLICKQKLGYPDYFVKPKNSAVVEVAAMNFYKSKNWHSCGLGKDGKSYSLRIGWLKNLRQDKKYLDVATPEFVEILYNNERGVS